MAGIKAADLQYVLNTVPLPVYQRTYNLQTELINVFGGFKRAQKARIQIPVHVSGNSTATSYGETDDNSTAGKQTRNLVTLPWKRYRVTTSVDGLQEAIAAAGGVINIKNMQVAESQDAVKDLLKEINTDLLGDGTGNSSKAIYGIKYHVDDDNTWASLDRSSATYSYLRSYMSENGGTARSLTKPLMNTVGDTLQDSRESNYDTILASRGAYNAYEDLFGDKARYVNLQIGDLKMNTLLFDNRPVVPIPGLDDAMYFINRGEWRLEFLPQPTLDSYGRQINGPFKVEPYYPGTDDATFIIYIYVQFICVNTWHQGKLGDLDV